MKVREHTQGCLAFVLLLKLLKPTRHVLFLLSNCNKLERNLGGKGRRGVGKVGARDQGGWGWGGGGVGAGLAEQVRGNCKEI